MKQQLIQSCLSKSVNCELRAPRGMMDYCSFIGPDAQGITFVASINVPSTPFQRNNSEFRAENK